MNMIHISERDSHAAADIKRGVQLLQAARDLMQARLSQALKSMLDKADDALFEFAEKSDNNAVQSVYFDAMREVRLKRVHIETTFAERLLAEFGRRCDRVGVGKTGGPADISVIKLSLVDDEAMEEDVAVANMVEKITNGCREELFALNKRVAVLLGITEPDQKDNPLGPQPLCEAIRQACTGIEAGIKIRLIILKLFDRYVSPEVEAIYQTINRQLVEQGVLPEIRAGVRKAASAAAHIPLAGGRTPAPAELPEGGDNLLAMLQQLLAPGAGGDGGGYTDGSAAAGLVGAGIGLMSTLTHLQQTDAGGGAMAAMPADAAGGPANVLRLIRTNGLVPQLDKSGDMTLDIVAMLFDYILDDKNLPDGFRALIGRLQIPILKVALIDRDFFSRKSHPARRLLNTIAQEAIDASGDPPFLDSLYQAAGRIVQRILDDYEDDVRIIAAALVDLEKAVAQARREAKIRAERTSKVVQGRSQLEHAKSRVRDEVEKRLGRDGVADFVRNFLLTHWRHLLITACVQEGETSASWRTAMETMDELIWSVTPKTTAADRQKLGAMLPGLLSRLKKGMESASMPAVARNGFLNRLAKCHAEVVRAGTAAAPPGTGAATAQARETAAPSPVTAATDFLDITTGAWGEIPQAAAPQAASTATAANPSGETARRDGGPTPDRLDATLPPPQVRDNELTQPQGLPRFETCPAPTETDVHNTLETTTPHPAFAAAVVKTSAAEAEIAGPGLRALDTKFVDSATPQFNPNQRIRVRTEDLRKSGPAGDKAVAHGGSLAEALPTKPPADNEVRLIDVIAERRELPEASKPVEKIDFEMTADAFYSMFATTASTGDDLARLADLGDVEIEELTLSDSDSSNSAAAIKDEHLKIVKSLEAGTWLEFRNEDGATVRARLTWINASTETYMFTDRNGHKIADRTRNGLVAEFRRGSARIAKDTPLLDRAFSRLLDGLSGGARSAGQGT